MLHDENYKRLFASPLMVQDVLRACLPAHRLAAADLSSLGELSPEYVSDELRTRHGDTVWHLRLGRRRAFLLVLLEFQAQDDRWMALRILTYTGLLLLELARNQPRRWLASGSRRCCRWCSTTAPSRGPRRRTWARSSRRSGRGWRRISRPSATT